MKKFFTHEDPVVPMHHPRVLVETAAAQGADRTALLQNVGITHAMLASPDVRISYVQFATHTYNALTLTNNPALGIDFGRNVHVSHMGVLGLALLSSPNLGAALQVGLRYYRSLAPAWDLELRIEGPRAWIIAREAIPLNPFRAFATEALLAAFDSQGQFLLGRKIPVTSLKLHYPQPPHVDRYEEFAPLLFGQDVTEAEFDAAILTEPLVGADPATAKLAEQYCAAQAPGMASVDGLVAQVRKVLGASQGTHPDLETLSRTLQTSARSLRRALHRMGTSYQALLDDARRTRAEAWVQSSEMTAEQIAERLGFSDVRSFRRAFKRWTGRSPNAFREGQLDA